MFLQSITLRRFRNISALDWAPARGINLIWGENGQGKTNLLEGIHLALSGRSFRTRHDNEMFPWTAVAATVANPGQNAEPTSVHVELARTRGRRTLRVLLASEEGKRVFANGALLRSLTALLNEAAVVVFTPE